MKELIKSAVTRAGGAAKVAESLGMKSRISVYEWITKGKIPPDRVLPLARLTDFEFTPHQLDSALYPNPTDGLDVSVSQAVA